MFTDNGHWFSEKNIYKTKKDNRKEISIAIFDIEQVISLDEFWKNNKSDVPIKGDSKSKTVNIVNLSTPTSHRHQ